MKSVIIHALVPRSITDVAEGRDRNARYAILPSSPGANPSATWPDVPVHGEPLRFDRRRALKGQAVAIAYGRLLTSPSP
jgi:hypothetical protein